MRFTVSLAVAWLAAASPAPAQDLGTRLDSALRVAEGKGFSGVVRVERDGKLLLERGYGLANRATKTRFTPATIVQIGSNTKDFTAVAILQLVEGGKLTLDDTIGRWFANAPADKRGIRVRQLLNHRAGFPLGIGGDFEPFNRNVLVDSAMRTALLFTPGARESYSNTGYSLLAAIIEQVTGKTYDSYVRDAILKPAKLTRTGFMLPGFKAGDLAHGYSPAGRDEGTMLAKPHAVDGPYWNLRGNGGMLSTASDMAAFYHALFESSVLLKPETRALRFNPNEPVGLAGSDGVHFFLYDRFPPARTEIIIASNNAAMKGPVVRKAIGDVLGLPSPDGDDNEQVAKRPGGRPASEPVAAILKALIATVNAGDAKALRAFITEKFFAGEGAPTVEQRLENISRMHDNLGEITIESIEVFDTGPAEIAVQSKQQGRGVIKANMDRTPPYKIRGLQVMIGG